MDPSTLEKQPVISAATETQGEVTDPGVSLRSATWASWLFLAGSLIFVVDAILENLAAVTLASCLHLSGSLLFAMGSWLLVPRRPH